MVDNNNKTWTEKLPEVWCAFRTTLRAATRATPYSLVFGGEVLLLEIQLPSLNLTVHKQITLEEKVGFC